jgi:hypothetical protein
MKPNSFLAETKQHAEHSRRKSEMVTALAELDAGDPEFFPTIISRMSDGEFISTIALELKVNYSILRNWIRGNKSREEQFAQAEIDGKQVRAQRARKKIYDTATADLEGQPTHADQLRAAEMVIKEQEESKSPEQRFRDITINFVAADNGKPKEVKGETVDQLP